MTITNTLYKDPARGKITGVCAGIANFLNTDPLYVRIGAIVLGFLTNGLVLLAYIALTMVLKVQPETDQNEASFARRYEPARPVPTEPYRTEPMRTARAPDPIDIELAEMKARQQRFDRELELADAASPSFPETPGTLEGDTSRKSGRTLEGVPASKRKV